jgi:DNA-binding transcriptional regulator YiaG
MKIISDWAKRDRFGGQICGVSVQIGACARSGIRVDPACPARAFGVIRDDFHHAKPLLCRLPVIEVCHAADEYGNHNPVEDSELPIAVRKLKRWRRKNKLSQRQAAEVMKRSGFAMILSTLQGWERGYRQPGRIVAQALIDWLEANPVITDPPKYHPGPPPSA